MKSKHLLLTLLLALFVPWAANAQETLTVYGDGTQTTNNYVPMYGGYFDDFTKSEFVIPAAKLEDMEGGTITSMKFYISEVSTYGTGWANTHQTVFLKEITSTTLSAYSGMDGATIVFDGMFTVPASTDTEFEIEFTANTYEYQGGNLLVGIYNTVDGSYRSVYWYGESVTGASGGSSNGTSLDNITFSQRNFIPKTTFTYEPASQGDCEKPETVTASQITPNTAMLNWEGGSTPTNGYNVELKGGQYADWTRYASNISQGCLLNHLIENTAYQARVQVVCSTTEASGWKNTSFTTPAYFSNFNVEIIPGEGNKAIFSWTENGFTPSDWQLCINGDENNLISMTSNPFTYDGLTPEVATTAKMRAFVGDNTGAWSNTVTFTPTDAYVITVNEGENTNYYIPFYYSSTSNSWSNYSYVASQFIIPATDLTNLQWGSIEKLTFYNSLATNTYGATYTVYLAETSATTQSAYTDWASLTQVYTGTVSVSDYKMTIEFDQPFAYTNGNLLVGFKLTTTGTSGYSCTWKGVNGTTSGVSRYSTTSTSTTASSFLPQMTIEYTPGVAPSCLPPTGLDVVAAGQDATFTWESDATQWQVAHATTATANPNDNIVDLVSTKSFTMNDLPLGDHYFWVRTYCSATDQSMWAGPASVHIGYCTPSINNVDGNGFTNVTFGIAPTQVNNDVPKTTYADFTNLVGAVQAGVEATIAITNSTGYDYGTIIWVDLNKNLSFEDNEIMFVGTAPDSSTPYEATITIPATQAVGDYVMRIGGTDSSFDDYISGTSSTIPSACFSTSWGTCQDYTLHVLEAPSCLTPTNLVLSRNNNQITATWEGTASTYNIDINGTVTNNVTSPYNFTAALSTTYTVKVQANCTGGETSDWSNTKSITTPDCWDGHVIEYTLTDSYNDGWESASITVVEGCGNVVATLTTTSSTVSGTLMLCGDYYQFIHNTGTCCQGEHSWTFTEGGETIFSGTGSNYDDGEVLYTIGTQSCPAPTTLTAGTAEARSVALTWNENGEATAWQICLNNDEENLIDVVENFTVTAGVVSYTLNGLTPDTDYTIKVRANCGEEQSCWSDEDIFSTIVACPVPTTLDVAEATTEEEKAVLTWVAGGTETAWNIQLATYNDANETWSEYEVIEENFNKTTYPIERLTAGTTYRVQVQAVCGGVYDDMSEWSDYFEFTTVATCVAPTNLAVTLNSETALGATVTWEGTNDHYVVEYREAATLLNDDFEKYSSGLPTNWQKVGSGTVAISSYSTTHIHSGTKSMRFSGATSNVVALPEFGFEANQLKISFYTKAESGTNSSCGKFEVGYLTNVNDASTFVRVGEQLDYSDYGSYQLISNVSMAGAPDGARIAFRHLPTTTNWYWFVDDVVVERIVGDPWTVADNNVTVLTYTFETLNDETKYEARVKGVCGSSQSQYSNVVKFTTLDACPAPTNFTLGEVTGNSAAFSWTQPTNGVEINEWVVKYRKSGETEYMTLTPNPTVTNATIEDLDANTEYEVVIAPACNEVKTLEDIFGTPCDEKVISLGSPYTYDFASSAEWDCWNNVAGTNDLNGGHLRLKGTTTGNIVALPEFDHEISDLMIVFWTRPEDKSYSSCGTFEVGYMTDLDDKTTFMTVLDEPYSYDDWTSNTYERKTAVFTDAPAGAHIAFRQNASSTSYYWFVDDVTVGLPQNFSKEIAGYGAGNEEGKANWYLIASPVGDMDPTEVTNMTQGAFDLYYFDQSEDLEWINYEDTDDGGYGLYSGMGYLYANQDPTTITFTGVANLADSTVILSKTANTEFEGLNLVGNPFGVQAYINKPYYRMEEGGAEIMSTSSSDAINVMEGVFVIAATDGEELTFSTTAPNLSNSANLNLNLSQANRVIDRAIVSFGKGEQLPKFQLNKSNTKVYIPVEGKDYAIANAESNVGEIPVSFEAKNNGTYTLSFTNEEVSFAYLHLIDNMTGEDVNLLVNPSYTFEARTTDYASRFKLVFATGSSTGSDTFAYYSNGNWVINNEGRATLQVVDVNGRILKSESINGCANVNFKAAAGIYMIRLVNGDNVKVQKVVVR